MLTYIAFGIILAMQFTTEDIPYKANMGMVATLLIAWLADSVILIVRALS